MKRLFNILFASFLFVITATAQAPDDYYSSCEGKSGQTLLSALFDVIGNHTVVGYSELWTVYCTSDIREDGSIWDMYSTKHWVPQDEQCGNYSNVGDCYNREHSFPKSWFDDASPMYSDAFHIYPTDGKVNGQRGNYPYGECANGEVLSAPNGIQALGKLGTSTFDGYSGIVFEPADEYKGDFARTYFYMAACYNNLIEDWSSPMLAGNDYPCYTTWAIKLLLKWHRQDPVSQKEIDRNNVIYRYQNNRNPFIDYPALAEHVWGEKNNEGWTTDSNVVKPDEGDGNDDNSGNDSGSDGSDTEETPLTDFLEDFEQDATGMNSYSPSSNYQGTASVWKFSNAGMWSSDVSIDNQSVRFGKTSSSYIEMVQDKTHGCGIVSFYAKKWGNDNDATIQIEYSTDQGITWTAAGMVSITDDSQYVKFSVTVNVTGNIRLRFTQTAGARFNIDNIAITNYKSSGIEHIKNDSWKVYCKDGRLAIDTSANIHISIFDIDGHQRYQSIISEGTTILGIPIGLYFISGNGCVKRVLIK